jgi:hypothetical protein
VSGVRPGGLEDRYVAPLEANRRGAHRARPNPLLGILPMVAVAAVVVAVAGGIVAVLGGGGLLPTGDKTVAGSSIGGSKTTPAVKPSTPASTASTSVKPSAPVATSAEPTGSASPTEPGAGVDKTVKVTVHNSTSPAKNRLAGRVTAKLKSADWTGAITAGGLSAGLDQTIVYYASSDLKATAEDLVAQLGVGSAQQSSRNSRSNGSIGVFIGNDYQE